MTNRSTFLIVNVALTGLLALPATAQTAWNRSVEAVAIQPATGGAHRITAMIGVDGGNPTTPLDLSTEIEIFVNGSLVGSQTIGFDVTPAGAASGCGISCFTFQPCICCNVGGDIVCSCGGLFVAPSSASAASLRPGDEIMVLLRPAPGALPEPDASDDRLVISNIGSSGEDDIHRFWDRRVASAHTEINAAGGRELHVGIEVAANYDGFLGGLDAALDVLADGVVIETIPIAVDDLFWDQCIGNCGEVCVMDAVGNFYGTCQAVEDYASPCTCLYQPVPDIIVPIDVEPGGGLTVVLRPVPGALPELPGFPDDEADVDPNPCPADLTGDAIVGFGDLTALLNTWGPCPPDPAPCPADFNDDDQVGFADLTELLNAWGPCFPV